MSRSRLVYLILIIGAVILGMASRRFRSDLPSVISTYAGDILWASMIFFIAAGIWTRASTRAIALGSLLFCFGIELSQLYHAPWIDALRSTRLGGLVLGFGFLWSDLVCYTIGIGIASGVDLVLSPRCREKKR